MKPADLKQVLRKNLSPQASRMLKIIEYLLGGLLCFAVYGYLYVYVLGLTLPKTLYLEHVNSRVDARFTLVEQHIENIDDRISEIRLRDNSVYRSIFGMQQLPPDSGIDTVCTAPESDVADLASRRVEMLGEMVRMQESSFDEVESLSRRAEDMASCIPNFSPVDMHHGRVEISSPFGNRIHPISQVSSFHKGIDIRGPIGLPIYAAADGEVESAENTSGYGLCIVINHGFGYKTRYAHLNRAFVGVGQKVKRGERIARMGRSGRATGSHLHYEVIFRNNAVNPVSYLDDLSAIEYRKMTRR